MTFDEYQLAAMSTASTSSSSLGIVIAALGLAGESGEAADHVKKWLAQGHDLDRDQLAGVIGDVLWYVALAAESIGFTLDEIAVRNIEKLRARYPDRFSSEASRGRERLWSEEIEA